MQLNDARPPKRFWRWPDSGTSWWSEEGCSIAVSSSLEETKCSSWYSLHHSRHRYFSSCMMNMDTKVLSEQQSWFVSGAIGLGCTMISSSGVAKTLNLLPVHIWVTCLLLVQIRS